MSSPFRVEMAGPLSVFAPGFVEHLVEQGYRPDPAAKQLRLVAHLSRWLAERDLVGRDLSAHVEHFLAERRQSHRHCFSAKGIKPLLDYLRGLGVVPAAAPVEPHTPDEQLLDRYSTYLLRRRGVSASTVRNYGHVARAFLADRERRRGALALDELDAATVNAFVLSETRRSSVGSMKCTVTRLRCFLRFLHVEGEITRDLTGAVPRIASWRLASLVKALDADSIAGLLRSCDVRTPFGRRDLAAITLMSRLGLRAGEVITLRLDDIDWRAGEVTVRGKGTRQEQLPVPVDVGEALADWLRDGRPCCDHSLVFTRLRAPHTGLTPTAIKNIVKSACKRAGLPVVNAHRLRHTAATEMLRAGASLADVRRGMPGELLTLARHYLDPVARAKLAAVAVPRGPERWELSTRAPGSCGHRMIRRPHIPIYCHPVVVLSTASPGQPRDSHS